MIDANHLVELLEALDAAEGRGALPHDVAGAFRVLRDHVMADDDVNNAANRLLVESIDKSTGVRVYLDNLDDPVAAVVVVLGAEHVAGVREHLKTLPDVVDVANVLTH